VAWKVAVGISPESLERGKLLQQQHIASGQINVAKKRPCPIPIDAANKMDRPGPKIQKMDEPKTEPITEGPEINGVVEPNKLAQKIFIQFSNVTNRNELKVYFCFSCLSFN
jgi:hypothetical protein